MAKKNKPEDGPEDKQDNGNEAEDSFGLPDLEYKPLDQGKEESPAGEDVSTDEPKQEERYVYTPPVEEKSKAPIVIGLVIAAVILIAGFLIYNYVYVPGQERAKQEEIAKKKAADEKAAKDKQARLEREREADRQKAIADSLAIANAKPAVGAIEVLSQRTRRYYVVISTAIDDDLVMDYAKKLSKKGVATKIIPPFGNTKFTRLAIADHDTYAKAQTNADEAKATYSNEVWVVRY
jgi:cytoskeletal protein RodZ